MFTWSLSQLYSVEIWNRSLMFNFFVLAWDFFHLKPQQYENTAGNIYLIPLIITAMKPTHMPTTNFWFDLLRNKQKPPDYKSWLRFSETVAGEVILPVHLLLKTHSEQCPKGLTWDDLTARTPERGRWYLTSRGTFSLAPVPKQMLFSPLPKLLPQLPPACLGNGKTRGRRRQTVIQRKDKTLLRNER